MSYTENPKLAKYRKMVNGELVDANWFTGTHKTKDIGVPGEMEIVKRKGANIGTPMEAGMGALSLANSFIQANEATNDRKPGEPKSMGAAIAQGVATGAGLGAMTGNPIGIAVGAVGGAAVAAWNNDTQRKEFEKQEKNYEARKGYGEHLYGKGLIEAKKSEAFKKYTA
jgi:hypothetical protein